MLLTLNRIDNKTIGVLSIDDKASFITLEPSSHRGQRVPEGIYQCERIVSPKFKETFTIKDIPGRKHIHFHKGNYAKDTEGCILVGNQLVNSEIFHSKDAFDQFMFLLNGVKHIPLQIKNAGL